MGGEKLGQLIKLQDYVSRYEQNIYNYPSRFVRLKKQQWEKLFANWESGLLVPREELLQQNFQKLLEEDYKNDKTMFDRVKGLFKGSRRKKDGLIIEEELNDIDDNDENNSLAFSPYFSHAPETVDELKQQFLDQLFRFQMRWASSTLTEKSSVGKQFYFDQNLKYFLQRFPDNILVLYKPIFVIKKAPVETEVILITPTEVQCISFVEKDDDAVFIGSTDNFWEMRTSQKQEKVLNPILAVNRMGNIVLELFRHNEIDFPVRKIILSRNGYIDYPLPPNDVDFIEKRNYMEWFTRLRSQPSPLKHIQLKSANVLLQHCQTISYKRLEWEQTSGDND